MSQRDRLVSKLWGKKASSCRWMHDFLKRFERYRDSFKYYEKGEGNMLNCSQETQKKNRTKEGGNNVSDQYKKKSWEKKNKSYWGAGGWT